MNRGTIVDKNEKSAVLLTPDGEFVRVKARGDAGIGQEVEWSESDRLPVRAARAARTRRRFAGAAFAAVLLMLVAALWSFRPPTVVAYVSMDINPSMEMGLDAKERVRELNALNPDAEAILQGIPYKGKPVEQVMRLLAQKLADAELLNPDAGEIVIASVRLHTVDEAWESHVIEKMESALRQAGTDKTSENGNALAIETVYLPAEVREEARERGISSGKMAVWLAAESEGYEVKLDDLKEKSVEAIASSLGGVKKVLEESRIVKNDKTAWKEMLAERKKAEQEAEKQDKQQEKQQDKQLRNKQQDKSQDRLRNWQQDQRQDGRQDKPQDQRRDRQQDQWRDQRQDQQDRQQNKSQDRRRDKQGDKLEDKLWDNGQDRRQDEQPKNMQVKQRGVDPGYPLVREDGRDRDKDGGDRRGDDNGRNDGKDEKKAKDTDWSRRDLNGKERENGAGKDKPYEYDRRTDDRRG